MLYVFMYFFFFLRRLVADNVKLYSVCRTVGTAPHYKWTTVTVHTDISLVHRCYSVCFIHIYFTSLPAARMPPRTLVCRAPQYPFQCGVPYFRFRHLIIVMHFIQWMIIIKENREQKERERERRLRHGPRNESVDCMNACAMTHLMVYCGN